MTEPLHLNDITWQGLERFVARLLAAQGFEGVRLVGRSGDQGADLLAHRANKRWVFQIKRWKRPANVAVIDETLRAQRAYKGDVPVVIALHGFDSVCREHQAALMSRGVPIQLWDKRKLEIMANDIGASSLSRPAPRSYQEDAITSVCKALETRPGGAALVVMATGLGKTVTAAEAIRRSRLQRPLRTLVLAHTNELVYQLEKSFWPYMPADSSSLIWNGTECPSQSALRLATYTFACINSVYSAVHAIEALGHYDVVLIDECHHIGGAMYSEVINALGAGIGGATFLLGLTATPWRPLDDSLDRRFGSPIFTMDMIAGLRQGFLSNVDYRMFTDNINWAALASLRGTHFSPRRINRTLFLKEWDHGVLDVFASTWRELSRPRAIIFCSTISHAITMRDHLRSLGHSNAQAIYSQARGEAPLPPWKREAILADFHLGTCDILCAVDVLNEGVDVPDVNLIVFQRVTHSRRIFVQQLGRGLRLSEGKSKVIVLDFVSDIRRFAAGLQLQQELATPISAPRHERINHEVTFRRADGEDPRAESFLRHWLEDVAGIQDAGEDASVLRFPPLLPHSKQ